MVKDFTDAQLITFGVTEKGNPYVIFTKVIDGEHSYAWSGIKYHAFYGNYIMSSHPYHSSEGVKIVEKLKEEVEKML